MNIPKTIAILSLVLCSFYIQTSAQNGDSKKKPEGSKEKKPPLPPVIPLSKMPDKVLDEMNKVRKNPQSYLAYLWYYRQTFDGNQATLSDGAIVVTNEGLIPVNEAIRELNDAAPRERVSISATLSKAAGEHVADLVKNNITGHSSSDGRSFDQRIAKFGVSTGGMAENIVYQSKLPFDIVASMIIDDGTASRSHRKNLLSTKFRKVGIAVGNHPKHGLICVVIFAENFSENNGKLRQF